MKHYKYEASGLTANGQTWNTKGMLSGSPEGGFAAVPNAAMAASLRMLTERANKNECRGPYTIHRLVIEQVFTSVTLEPETTRQ
jgi:hypothetical protein